MTTRKVDLVSKKILSALAEEPGVPHELLAKKLGLTAGVVRDRIAQMTADGVMQPPIVRFDAAKLGMPHEVFVTATPSAETTKEALTTLAGHPGVTRVLTLAARRSIAFTLCGTDLEGTQNLAHSLADRAGLIETEVTLIVNTLHDDASRAIGRALQPAQ